MIYRFYIYGICKTIMRTKLSTLNTAIISYSYFSLSCDAELGFIKKFLFFYILTA